MFLKTFKILILFLTLLSCSNSEKEFVYEPSKKKNPYILYKQGLESFEQNDFTYASKIFTEAELNFETVEMSAKSAIMSIFCLYSINFYDEALDNLNRYLKKYPADKNIIYAHYLIAIIYFEN